MDSFRVAKNVVLSGGVIDVYNLFTYSMEQSPS